MALSFGHAALTHGGPIDTPPTAKFRSIALETQFGGERY
jgi:hypothetical protein